jgi:ribonuclease T1
MKTQGILKWAGVRKLALAAVALCFVACSRWSDEPRHSTDAGGYEQETTRHDEGGGPRKHKHKRQKDRRAPNEVPENVPEKVLKVLKYVDEHHKAPRGYVGGRRFENRERRLAARDRQGKPIRYQEWDVNPKIRGKNRGPERLVTGSDRSAYYTSDHYKTFKKIR